MRQITFLHKTFLLGAMMVWAATGYAQQYETDRGRVYYNNEIVLHADARSFVDLGCGYAKDFHNVYMNGRVLENVDPSTFRLKNRATWRDHGRREEEPVTHRGYFKTNMNVYYGDRKLDAMAHSFVELEGGYAKDAFNVYYCGEKIKGVMASSFNYVGGGYAKDSFNVYYRGEKVKGAMASSFKYTGDGYGQDSFNAYYRGKKIE
jgi:hypothetical protein